MRHQPYDIVIKAEDSNRELQLVDIDNMSIKVLGPSPVLLSAVPVGKFVQLTWAGYVTDQVFGFSIYRREGASTLAADTCYDGIPPSSGFVKVGYVGGFNSIAVLTLIMDWIPAPNMPPQDSGSLPQRHREQAFE
ncbi:MAG: hypothetical protein R2756_05240 [Bacteroidales bacterium]